MPHQNPNASTATAQNAATDRVAPKDGDHDIRQEPRSYAAPDVADASLAPPAAGEVTDFMDEGDALGHAGLQQGGDRTARPDRTEAQRTQGPKTLAGNKERVRSGTADPKPR